MSQHNAKLQGENARLQVENTTLQSQSASLIAQNSALQSTATQSDAERDKVGIILLLKGNSVMIRKYLDHLLELS